MRSAICLIYQPQYLVLIPSAKPSLGAWRLQSAGREGPGECAAVTGPWERGNANRTRRRLGKDQKKRAGHQVCRGHSQGGPEGWLGQSVLWAEPEGPGGGTREACRALSRTLHRGRGSVNPSNQRRTREAAGRPRAAAGHHPERQPPLHGSLPHQPLSPRHTGLTGASLCFAGHLEEKARTNCCEMSSRAKPLRCRGTQAWGVTRVRCRPRSDALALRSRQTGGGRYSESHVLTAPFPRP